MNDVSHRLRTRTPNEHIDPDTLPTGHSLTRGSRDITTMNLLPTELIREITANAKMWGHFGIDTTFAMRELLPLTAWDYVTASDDALCYSMLSDLRALAGAVDQLQARVMVTLIEPPEKLLRGGPLARELACILTESRHSTAGRREGLRIHLATTSSHIDPDILVLFDQGEEITPATEPTSNTWVNV